MQVDNQQSSDVKPSTVDLLILGAGWTSKFLIPLCQKRGLTAAATTRSGRDDTILFVFDPTSEDTAPFSSLPDARTVLITFPITIKGASTRLTEFYAATHLRKKGTRFIQLGTTSIWDGSRHNPGPPVINKWYDRHSPFTPGNERAEAEVELLSLNNEETPTTVLNLSGLWGGDRNPRKWLSFVAPSKEALRAKGSLHLIHGTDLARAILAAQDSFSLAAGKRWLLTDGRVYDWWDLSSAWSTSQDGPQARWVSELMRESGVRALPRNAEVLGRALDSREFWETFGIWPLEARIESG